MAGTSPRIDIIEGQAALAAAVAQSQGLGTLIDTSSTNMIAVPNTTIVNRALIVNLASDVGVRLGLNRIPVQYVYPMQGENGPNGEPVFAVLGDAVGQMRFVGTWYNGGFPTFGAEVNSSNDGDYVEVCFYGVGINLLAHVDTGSRDWRVSVDGGAEGANVYPSSGSGVLNARNYAKNNIITLASGLSLGFHTVKLRLATANNTIITGFEMIHQSGTSSNLIVNQGNVIGLARKGTLGSQQLVAYNSGFDSGSLGTTGGRVISYLKSDNTFGKSVTPTAASPSYLTSASHTNEEVARQFFHREFAAGRSDDFSVLNSVASRTFILDDGVTTLTGTSVRVGSAVVDAFSATAGTSNGFSITFIGTGLDLLAKNDFDSTTRSASVSVDDGASVGTISVLGNTNNVQPQVIKVASGLPYGAHCITFTNTSGSTDTFQVAGFKIYQPLTPALPAGAIELARYNIMANFSSSNVTDTTAGHINQLSQGALFKGFSREVSYFGSGWSYGGAINYLYAAGQYWQTSTLNDSLTYTFWGIGVVLRLMANGSSYTFSTKIDGVLTSGTVLTGATNNGGGNYTSDAVNSKPVSVQLSGLTLGLHTVTLTNTQSGVNMFVHGVEVITPIHAYKDTLPGDLQNTLMIGSQGIGDSRAVNAQQKSKAWAQAFGVTSAPTNGSSTSIPMPDMSVSIRTQGGPLRISHCSTWSNNTVGGGIVVTIVMDGMQVGQISPIQLTASANFQQAIADTVKIPASPGYHKIDLYWSNNGLGTVTGGSTWRTLTVEET